jgi:transcriptional regulator with PAS, ATPase and Fis domain
MEKQHIQKVLKLAAGNKTQAAKILGIGLTTLYQKIKDYKI